MDRSIYIAIYIGGLPEAPAATRSARDTLRRDGKD